MSKEKMTLLFVLQIAILVSCKKDTSATYINVKVSETLIRYTNHYDDAGKLLTVQIEEKNTFYPITKKINNSSGQTNYKYKEKKYIYGDHFTETVETNENGDLLLYEKKITDSMGRSIEQFVKMFKESEFGLSLEEYSISRDKYDEASGKNISQTNIDLMTGDTVLYESIYSQLKDTLIENILSNRKLLLVKKTYHDKKNNVNHELEYNEDNVLVSQTASWMNKNNEVFLKTSSRKSGEGTYMNDSIFYQDGKIVRHITKDPPLISLYVYKYDEKRNLVEEVNELSYLKF